MSVDAKKQTPTTMDIKEIMSILPHRYPFLLVDKITHIDMDNKRIIGVKNLTMNEAFFQGHFPHAPIMPGVLILEALAQTGGILVHLNGSHDRVAALLNINNAKFRHPVRPGDVLTLKCEAKHLGNKGGRFEAQAFVEDKLVADAEISFVLMEKEKI